MSGIIIVVEGLTKALELARKSKDFFGQFEAKRKQIFLNHIHPAFESLKPVLHAYGDDISTFRSEISDAPDYAAAERAIVNFDERRRKTVRERSEVIESLDATLIYFSKNIGADGNRKALECYGMFMLRLSEYFRNYDHLPSFCGTVTTYLLDFAGERIRNRKPLTKAEQRRQWPSAKAEILGECTAAIKILEKEHARVFSAYTELKLACIGESSLARKS